MFTFTYTFGKRLSSRFIYCHFTTLGFFSPFKLHNRKKSLFFYFIQSSAEDELRSQNSSALYSGVTAADTSVSFARWQQGEQTVAGVGVVSQLVFILIIIPAINTSC